MDWLRRLMIGRYGGDQLSVALVVLSIVLTLIANLVRLPIVALTSYIPLGLCVYRMFSKDISKRSMENYKFAMWMSPVYSWYRKKLNRLKDAKTYKYFKCPACKATLRLPRGKGKVMITCTKCKTEFQGKS